MGEPVKPLGDQYWKRFRPFFDRFLGEMGYEASGRGLTPWMDEYLTNPIGTSAKENKVLAANPRLPTLAIVDKLVELHSALQEKKWGKPPEASEQPTTENYEIIQDVWALVEDDLLPGRGFEFGKERSYYRELLVVSRKSPLIHNALREAKLLGVYTQRNKIAPAGFLASLKKIVVGTHETEVLLSLAETIYDNFRVQYSEHQDQNVVGGGLMTFGGFMEDGGCCRHRAGTLALVLQEAGVWARYVQGLALGRKPHAWVEVYEIKRAAKPFILLDPNMDGEDGRKGHKEFVVKDQVKPNGSYSIWHHIDQENIVWRPTPNL